MLPVETVVWAYAVAEIAPKTTAVTKENDSLRKRRFHGMGIFLSGAQEHLIRRSPTSRAPKGSAGNSRALTNSYSTVPDGSGTSSSDSLNPKPPTPAISRNCGFGRAQDINMAKCDC